MLQMEYIVGVYIFNKEKLWQVDIIELVQEN